MTIAFMIWVFASLIGAIAVGKAIKFGMGEEIGSPHQQWLSDSGDSHRSSEDAA